MRCDNLQLKLSIRVQFISENLVGSVIYGKKLRDEMTSKYSLKIGLSLIFNRSIFQSPAMTTSLKLLLILVNRGVSSFMDC